jgi:hypothetical protein
MSLAVRLMVPTWLSEECRIFYIVAQIECERVKTLPRVTAGICPQDLINGLVPVLLRSVQNKS